MHGFFGRTFIGLLVAALLPIPSTAQVAPELSVVGTFFAGPAPRKLEQLQRLSLSGLRDGLRWQDVEPTLGAYSLDTGSAAQLTALQEWHLLGTILLQPQTPLLNRAMTVTEPTDLRTFAHYVREVAANFPQSRLEIANEFNGGTFITGPALTWPTEKRARLHAEMLEQIAKAGVPRARIIGGAMHSMAGGYLWPMLSAGAADHINAVAIHPYTTAPEAFPRQLSLLREHPEMSKLHVDVTEFGTRAKEHAADYFWRYYCQMARAGVRQAHWYPLDPRKDGYVSVLDAKRSLTSVGRAVVFVASTLAGKSVEPLQPDSHTYGCLFAQRTLVIWGAKRLVRLHRQDLEVRGADGRELEGPLKLSRDRVLIIKAAENVAPIDPSTDLSFGQQPVIFDSFDQFGETTNAPYLTIGGQRQDFSICPGQDRPEAPWFPHLCTHDLPRTVLHDRGFTLPNRHTRFHLPIEVPQDAKVQAVVNYDVNQASVDGVEVLLRLNGVEQNRLTLRGKGQETFDVGGADHGAVIEVVLASGPNAKGDRGKFRLQVIRR